MRVDDVDLPAVELLRSGGRGPAAARNVGWRRSTAAWVAFLDDDVLVTATWLRDLADDLAGAQQSVAGSQGRITVPLPASRRPNDWERGTAGLETARWITADMAYRRAALLLTGGFDERFPRAFREDADLALRMLDNGFDLTNGCRRTIHPVRPSRWWASVGQQRGNADDPLMRRLHGPAWRTASGGPARPPPAASGHHRPSGPHHRSDCRESATHRGWGGPWLACLVPLISPGGGSRRARGTWPRCSRC